MVTIYECVHLMHKFGDVKISKIFDEHIRLSVDVTEDCRLEAELDKHRAVRTVNWVDDREEMPEENLYFAPVENFSNISDIQKRLIKAMANSLKLH